MKLDPQEIETRLKSLPGWATPDGFLAKEFIFDDFVQAFAFMTATAQEAVQLNHHPEWSNVYNKVSVKLSTHDAGGITDLDFELAAKMNELAESKS